MYKIIIIGHGEYSKGIKNSLDLVIGEQEDIYFISFNGNLNVEELSEYIKKDIGFKTEEKYLFLTDLRGGTPFNSCVLIEDKYRNSSVIGGCNIPMVLSAIEHKEELSLKDAVSFIIKEAREEIYKFEYEDFNQDFEEEGI